MISSVCATWATLVHSVQIHTLLVQTTLAMLLAQQTAPTTSWTRLLLATADQATWGHFVMHSLATAPWCKPHASTMALVRILSTDLPATVLLDSRATAVNLTSMSVQVILAKTLELVLMVSIHLPVSVPMLGMVLRVRYMSYQDCALLSHHVPMVEGAWTRWILTSATV